MSQKRVKKKSRLKKTKSKDGRIKKVIGISIVLLSVYLLIALSSYFFTWKSDQDKVLQFSWQILFQEDLRVDNWLGRLGAVLSNFFFYWGFGIASILFVPLFAKLGVHTMRGGSFLRVLPFAQKWFLFIAFISILCDFLFARAGFPWGGAFGNNICYWLTSFVGQIGLFILLLFATIAWAVWRFNPSFEVISYFGSAGVLSLPRITFFKGMMDFKFWRSGGRAKEDSFGTIYQRDLTPDKESQQENEAGISHGYPELELADDLQPHIKDNSNSNANKPIFGDHKSGQTPNTAGEARPEVKLETVHAADLSEVPLDVQQGNQNHDELFDPVKELSHYKFPELDCLEDYSDLKIEIDREELEANKNQIIKTLLNYKIEIIKIRATIGPTVTLYEIVPAAGIKISKIKNLEDDIALSLAALGIRIIAPIPGKGTIGIEVPNKKPQIVSLKEVLRSDKFQNAKMDLPIALGKTIANEVFVADLAKMPHLLIAGATGQGKSVGINTVLMSLLFKKHPSQVKFVLIDPKKVELFPYNHVDNHFLAYLPEEDEPIVTETKKVIYTLNSLCIEMDDRYDLLKKARARNIKEYNEKFTQRKLNPLNGHKFMPFIILVIDEFADLIMTAGKEIELPIARLAQLARAVGIHLIIATQRPSVNIITGVIKANFPARIAYKVTSKIDSRTILDQGGADQLIGRGDMLLSVGGNLVRLQCAFVDTPEVENVIDFIARQRGFPEPFLLPEYTAADADIGDGDLKLSDLDDMFREAAQLVVANQHGSTSMIQRKLQLGYNRAGRIMDQLELMKIVGPAQGSKPREVYVHSEMELMGIFDRVYSR